LLACSRNRSETLFSINSCINGVNIAQTGKTTDYLQSDELWWIRGKADGVYISESHYDQSADVYSTDIGFRVSDNRGGFLGVIKAVTNVDQVYKP